MSLWIGPSLGVTGQSSSGAVAPVNILAALSWQAGVSTTLSVAGGKARATATNGTVDNPRIFKGPFHTTAGVTYRYQGTIYPGTSSPNMFLRVSQTNAIQNDGPVQEVGNPSGPLVINNTWTAGLNIDLYVGLVGIVNADGQFCEIDDNFSITVVP